MTVESGREKELELADGPGHLTVISGPSGVGKTALIDQLLDARVCVRAITATTRAPREGEVNGVHYVFYADRESFLRDVNEGRFLEHAEVHGNLYGTPLEPLNAQIARGATVVLNIDVQGAQTLLDAGVAARFVFIDPPSFEELERRLRGRGTEGDVHVEKRLAEARRELECGVRYQYRVVNDEFQTAIANLTGILTGPRESDGGTQK